MVQGEDADAGGAVTAQQSQQHRPVPGVLDEVGGQLGGDDGHLLGALFQAPFWMLTASEGRALVDEQLLSPLAIAAFIIGRELTIWFGAWVSARGARVTELNVEAQREYERTLEAGPQLTRV